MEKVKYKYAIGDEVFGISEWMANGQPSGHYAILKARINAVYITINNDDILIEYQLETPSGSTWGDVNTEDNIFSTYEEAMEWAYNKWEQLEDWK